MSGQTVQMTDQNASETDDHDLFFYEQYETTNTRCLRIRVKNNFLNIFTHIAHFDSVIRCRRKKMYFYCQKDSETPIYLATAL